MAKSKKTVAAKEFYIVEVQYGGFDLYEDLDDLIESGEGYDDGTKVYRVKTVETFRLVNPVGVSLISENK